MCCGVCCLAVESSWYYLKSQKTTRHPSQMRARTNCKLVRQAKSNPSVTWRSEEEYYASITVNKSTISQTLHKEGLYGCVARKEPSLKNTHLKVCLEHSGKYTIPTVMHGDSIIMVLDCFTFSGSGRFFYVQGTMDQIYRYRGKPHQVCKKFEDQGEVHRRPTKFSIVNKRFILILVIWLMG